MGYQQDGIAYSMFFARNISTQKNQKIGLFVPIYFASLKFTFAYA